MRIPPLQLTRRRARIEIIPLIDIIFFLLATFVMVSLSMIKNRAVPVNLPAAATAVTPERKSYVAVTVTEPGDVYLDKQKVNLKELSSQLNKLKKENPELQIFIHGDERADFGNAVRVLDEVRRLGINRVFIQAKPKSDSKAGARS